MLHVRDRAVHRGHCSQAPGQGAKRRARGAHQGELGRQGAVGGGLGTPAGAGGDVAACLLLSGIHYSSFYTYRSPVRMSRVDRDPIELCSCTVEMPILLNRCLALCQHYAVSNLNSNLNFSN